MERTEQLQCLAKVSRAIATAHQATSKGDNWIISQTTSPVDYSPVATATTLSNDGAAAETAMKLSIHCRRGRTELVVAGPGISGRGNDYAISYRVNDGQQMQIAAALPAFGAGVAFAGDVIRLLQSLPDAGSLSVRLAPRTGTALDGTFSLGGWEAVRAKMTIACKWSHPVAKRNR
ncbi:hypothetical protein [Bradyrhizobium sp. 170]|uniref:hypothetical protein n=1 Tax=Bradyrhizobium sp. 170 TaxID=2782641 RepID=UPI001FFF7CF3|nr:hypothetical protein [Bradyrhizobium sp. 170]